MTDPVVTPVPDGPTHEPTPEPVLKAAAVWGSLATVLVTLIGVASAVGVLSAQQDVALTDVVNYVSANLVPVGSAIVGIVGLVSGLAGSAATAVVGRRKVTPVAKAPAYRHEAHR